LGLRDRLRFETRSITGDNLSYALLSLKKGGMEGKIQTLILTCLTTGAGPAGVSTAHTLSTSFNSPNIRLEIVLFEQKSRIGGRMEPDLSSQLNSLGRNLHPGDVATGAVGGKVLRDRARSLLGIEFGAQRIGKAREVGFFDGRSIVAKVTRPLDGMGWGTWLTLLWKYKFSFLNAKELPTGTMASFGKLLRSQKQHDSVSDMVKAAELGSVVGMSAVERLRINGIAGDYVDEVLSPEIWRQTGQSVEELSDLAISMALEREARVSATDGGKLVTVLEEILKRSTVDLRLNTRINGLRKELVDEGNESWSVNYQRGGLHESEIFDYVVLAGPWNTSSILKDDDHQEEEVYYRPLFVTFLLSNKGLNKEYFGSLEEMPSQILPIPSANLPSELEGIHEISYLRDLYGPDVNTEAVQKLYRILSARSLSEQDILAFCEGDVLQSYEERIDNAYPLMWPRKEKFGNFKVQEGLWHTGVVEGIGSSVDLSWVAGENVARLLGEEIGRKRV
jgi:prenylcysteine oxidase/farnesylcysteine lyase